MALAPQFLDEIRSRVTLSDVIARRVKLLRRGREHVGLCPFHNEKTPSFTVNDDKGFFHCFGCGAHGDVIGFVMRTEGLSFPEAVEKLAGEAGLQMPVASPEERVRAKAQDTLHSVNEAACAWFEKQLRGPTGRVALDYLKGRGLTDDTIARFRLGYAPGGRDALRAALVKEGINEMLLIEAGLIGLPEDGRGAYDRFRNRVIFPITDSRGKVIAFGGRILGDGQPKYLNSPDTPLFNKGRVLYGLAAAREVIHKAGEAIVVEGYMDVIALHQAGIRTAVAPLGTALTEQQIEQLWRSVDEPILCFDGDEAGQRAAQRAAERALSILHPPKTLRFARLPAGEDPDSYIRLRGNEEIRLRLNEAIRLSEWLYQTCVASKPLQDFEDVTRVEKDIDELTSQIRDKNSQFYFKVFLRRRLYNFIWEKRDRKEKAEVIDLKSDVAPEELKFILEQGLIAAFINHPELISDGAERIIDVKFLSESVGRLFLDLLSIATENSKLDRDILVEKLAERGHSNTLGVILCDRIYFAAPFSSPRANEEILRAAWTEAADRVKLSALEAEFNEARQAYERSHSREDWDLVRALGERISEVRGQPTMH